MSPMRTLTLFMLGLIPMSLMGCVGPGAKSSGLDHDGRDRALRSGISRQLAELPGPVAQHATLYMQDSIAGHLPDGCRLSALSVLVKQGVLGSERFPFVLPLSHQDHQPSEPFGTMTWTVSQAVPQQCQWQGTIQYQEHTWTLTVDYMWQPQSRILAEKPATQARVTGNELAADASADVQPKSHAY